MTHILPLLVIILIGLYFAIHAYRSLRVQLASMTDAELHEESWWEGQDGHYPNSFSAELDRRERDQAARGTA